MSDGAQFRHMWPEQSEGGSRVKYNILEGLHDRPAEKDDKRAIPPALCPARQAAQRVRTSCAPRWTTTNPFSTPARGRQAWQPLGENTCMDEWPGPRSTISGAALPRMPATRSRAAAPCRGYVPVSHAELGNRVALTPRGRFRVAFPSKSCTAVGMMKLRSKESWLAVSSVSRPGKRGATIAATTTQCGGSPRQRPVVGLCPFHQGRPRWSGHGGSNRGSVSQLEAIPCRIVPARLLYQSSRRAGQSPLLKFFAYDRDGPSLPTLVGQSPMIVLRDLRMRQAAQQLRTTSLSVERIAGSVSHASRSSFVGAFHRALGQGPSNFRDASVPRSAQ